MTVPCLKRILLIDTVVIQGTLSKFIIVYRLSFIVYHLSFTVYHLSYALLRLT